MGLVIHACETNSVIANLCELNWYGENLVQNTCSERTPVLRGTDTRPMDTCPKTHLRKLKWGGRREEKRVGGKRKTEPPKRQKQVTTSKEDELT